MGKSKWQPLTRGGYPVRVIEENHVTDDGTFIIALVNTPGRSQPNEEIHLYCKNTGLNLNGVEHHDLLPIEQESITVAGIKIVPDSRLDEDKDYMIGKSKHELLVERNMVLKEELESNRKELDRLERGGRGDPELALSDWEEIYKKKL